MSRPKFTTIVALRTQYPPAAWESERDWLQRLHDEHHVVLVDRTNPDARVYRTAMEQAESAELPVLLVVPAENDDMSNAITIPRELATDARAYRAAREQAEAQGKRLVVVD